MRQNILFVVFVFSVFFGGVVFADYPRLTAGHAGLGLGEGSNIVLHAHAHGGEAVVDGEILETTQGYHAGPDGKIELIVVCPDATRFSRPSGAVWDLIGNGSGADTWALPETEQAGVPYWGVAGALEHDVFVDNVISLALTGMAGPTGGEFSLYNVSFGTPTFHMSTADGIDGADSLELEIHGHHDHEATIHAHYNWGFTAPGLYELTFRAEGVLDDGMGTVVSDTATYSFEVIPEPATLVLLAAGGLMAARKRLQ